MFTSTHKLDFLQERKAYIFENQYRFKVGTCHGLYTTNATAYQIIAIVNDEKGNGHFTDVLEWFENSAKRDGKNLEVVEIWNSDLKKHLVNKRGFVEKENGDVIKKI